MVTEIYMVIKSTWLVNKIGKIISILRFIFLMYIHVYEYYEIQVILSFFNISCPCQTLAHVELPPVC